MELYVINNSYRNLLWSTGESTASITVQTAATYTVTTTNASGCTSLQGSGVAAPKTTPTAPVVNVVNNCDGTLRYQIKHRNFIMSTGESTASITVQTAATYTVTTTNASGCTSLQGSGVALKQPTAPVVNVVNNCDGTSTLTATGTLLWSTGESTASITVQQLQLIR
jgi:uncharacterized protein YaiE (UPF0345 family)